MLTVVIILVPQLPLKVKSPILQIFDGFQHSSGQTVYSPVGPGTEKAKQGFDYQGIVESKLHQQYLMSYLGFSASVYFLYPGLFGQPYIH